MPRSPAAGQAGRFAVKIKITAIVQRLHPEKGAVPRRDRPAGGDSGRSINQELARSPHDA